MSDIRAQRYPKQRLVSVILVKFPASHMITDAADSRIGYGRKHQQILIAIWNDREIRLTKTADTIRVSKECGRHSVNENLVT